MNREKWNAFLRWPGWTAWLKWKGWTAWLKWPVWKTIGNWKGWKKLFVLHPLLTCLLTAAAGAGLAWVFFTGREESLPAIPVYVTAAYALTAICFSLPGWIRWGKDFVHSNALAHRIVTDEDLRLG